MAIVGTWNMQGANASTEVKWQTGVAHMLASGADILCLQECGGYPGSAQLQAGILAGNPNYRLYWWGTLRARRYISYYRWDVLGNRVNLAIVSEAAPTNWICVVPAAGPAWRPVIGALIGGVWCFSLHAISPGGADAAGLLAAAAAAVAAAGGGPWLVAGDFNREPTIPLPTGNVCIPNQNTYPTVHPVSRYDYMYSSGGGVVGDVQAAAPLLSDHLAVWYNV